MRLYYLSKIETSAITTVVVVSIHVKNLLAFDGQQARENAFCKASPQNDHLGSQVRRREPAARWKSYIVLLIHGNV